MEKSYVEDVRTLKNVSIYFSGYNIKPFADVAIRSFLRVYPELKDSVIYFDDESTDGTKELLDDLGIKSIGWDRELKDLYDRYTEEGIISNGGQALKLRCEFILKNILKDCKTRYLIVLDGDTITLKGGFIEELIDKELALLCRPGFMTCNTYALDETKFPLLSKYMHLSDEIVHLKGRTPYDYIEIRRAHPYHLCIDMEKLGDWSEMLDNLKDLEYIKLYEVDSIDVGTDLLHHIIINELSHEITNKTHVHHWTWVSSSMRDSEHASYLDDKFVINRVVKAVVANDEIRLVLDDLEVTASTLSKFHRQNIRTGKYN